MERQLRVLLLEDSINDAELIKRQLNRGRMSLEFRIVMDRRSFLSALDSFSPDIILSDHSLPRFNSGAALKIARQWMAHVPFILVTGTVSEEFAAEMINLGADDYILKDRMERLESSVQGALERRKTLRELSAYRYALDQSASVAITNEKGVIEYANEKFCEISKYSSEELIGNDHRMINSGYHPHAFFKVMWATISKGEIWRGEILNKAKDKSFYWVDTCIIPFMDANGKPYQYVAIRRDITEKKRIEQELMTANERFELVVRATNDVIWDWNLHHNTMWWNRNYYSYFGYPESEVPEDRRSFYAKIHPDDRKRVISGLMNSIERGMSTWTDEYRVICEDGRIAFILDCGYIVCDSEGNPYRVVGAMLDITKRKQMEEELRKSKDLFEYATQATSDIIWELDFQLGTSAVHHNKTRTFEDETVLKWQPGTGGDFILEADRKRVADSFHSAMLDTATQIWEQEYAVHASGKDTLVIANHAIFVRDDTGATLKSVGAITDITQKIKLQHELEEREKTEQIKLTYTAIAAQEKERNSIGLELHDNINQILVATKLMLSCAKEEPGSEAECIQSSLENIQHAIDETRKLAHELVAPDFDEIDLSTMIENLAENMLRKAGMDIYVHRKSFNDDLLDGEMRLSVYRIVQEQFTNIIKYSKAQVVNVLLSTTGGLFKMTIADDGVGIMEEQTANGIGLKNIRGRVNILGGKAWVISAEHKGFTLEVRIPFKISR